jgi:hypothetical protein
MPNSREKKPQVGGYKVLPIEWVAQVSLLRPGFLLASGPWTEHPGLKSETWATHSIGVRAIFIFRGKGI